MTNGTGPPGSSAPGGGMTIRVYTVDRYGTITGERGRKFVPYDGKPLSPGRADRYPPCACPRCRPAVDW
ncbi:hypothetical protein [Streptomyces sp. NPDC088812]|uniref:hypothetical protein n=1 Tax=Streptomyces sp. NPDC088812 TaxID=3365905 RepID=UPI0037F4A734